MPRACYRASLSSLVISLLCSQPILSFFSLSVRPSFTVSLSRFCSYLSCSIICNLNLHIHPPPNTHAHTHSHFPFPRPECQPCLRWGPSGAPAMTRMASLFPGRQAFVGAISAWSGLELLEPPPLGLIPAPLSSSQPCSGPWWTHGSLLTHHDTPCPPPPSLLLTSVLTGLGDAFQRTGVWKSGCAVLSRQGGRIRGFTSSLHCGR